MKAYNQKQQRYWRKPLHQDRVVVLHGDIHIITDRCKGCAFCVEYCPLGVLQLSARFNHKGYHPPEIVKEDTCVACHLCEVLCPEFAIYVLDQNSESADRPPIPENLPTKED